MGLIVATPETDGDYTISDNTLVTGQNPMTQADLAYHYCVANGTMTLTPKTSSPTTTGSIVLQKASGSGGAGGGGGGGGSGGTTGKGGSGGAGTGGTTGAGGKATGGAGGSGGAGTGGTTGAGGQATGGAGGSGGGTVVPPGSGPCDILDAAKTPCVAAYSMARNIYSVYKGPLYQVRSKSNKSNVKDVPLSSDGFVDLKVQDDFCASGGCTISKIYDQSPKKNDLALSPDTYWLSATGTLRSGGGARQNEADIGPVKGLYGTYDPKISVSGHPAIGVFSAFGKGNAYRVMKPNGTATGDDPEYIYAIYDTTVYNEKCCNDFGNAETTGNPDSFTSMEAIYFGNATVWGKGGGNGPWFSCDYEAVISPGGAQIANDIPSMTGIKKFATFILKGFSGDRIALKFGDAEKGELKTQYDGKRAAQSGKSGSPMHKQGSIILGSGGDGSVWSDGIWYEGVMTAGCNDDKAVDDAIQANIVAAGFGK
jgi:hypothetical protein